MHVMRDTEAWLSWLEHTVHIREVTGSSPVASTTFYQSAPVADWFFLYSFWQLNSNLTAFAVTILRMAVTSATLHAPLPLASNLAPLMSKSCSFIFIRIPSYIN